MRNLAVFRVRRQPWKAIAGLIVLLCCELPSVAAADPPVDPPRIAGMVKCRDGKPLRGALVSIVSAGPRAGSSLANPWCYPDCGKHAIADGDGAFAIRGIDDLWIFTLRVEAAGYCPEFVLVDPRAAGPVDVILEREGVAGHDSRHRVTALVLRPDGQPAAGALVTVRDYQLIGPPSAAGELDRTAKTDDEGRFTILREQPLAKVAVSVDARGTVQKIFSMQPGKQGNLLQLIEGTIVTGRVLKKARPVEGVTVGVVGLAPTYGEFSGTYEATTDRDGRFAIPNVYPDRDFYLFTRMSSLERENLAAIRQRFRSWGDRQITEVAELNLHPAHRVRGRLLFSDGKQTPPNIRAVLARADLLDNQEVAVDRDGRFFLQGVPSESVVLSFHGPGMNSIPGYQLSPQHFNLDYLRRTTLCGRVNDDLELVVLFEPGGNPAENDGPRPIAASAKLRPDDPLFAKQKRLEAEPLRGISADVNLLLGNAPAEKISPGPRG